MNNPADIALATEYLGYFSFGLDKDGILSRQGPESAVSAMYEFAMSDSLRCWEIAKVAFATDPKEDVLEHLGGLLSDLLVRKPEFIAIIENDARADQNLRYLVSWIQENEEIDRSVWQRIERVSSQ